MNDNKQLTVLYFGSYSLNNSRNAVLMRGLKKNGVGIIECNDHSRSYIFKYLNLFFKYLKYIGKFDVMIVGFSGQELMPLARILTRKPIIFDVFTSHYMGYVLDRKYFSIESWRARYYHFLDWFSCYLADIVLLDTQTHINFFVREFNLPRTKFHKVWLGANTELFKVRQPRKLDDGMFRVVFWGNFIPLQGVEYIIRAAKLLRGDDVEFYLVGAGGQTFESNRQLTKNLELDNVHFTGRLSQEELGQIIADADVCLGAFGDSIKTDSTIQNKIFEALASGRAVITARTPAIQELLQDGKQCVLCRKADPGDLAEKIMQLKHHPDLKTKIAEAGLQFFTEHLTEKKLGYDLLNVINPVRDTLNGFIGKSNK